MPSPALPAGHDHEILQHGHARPFLGDLEGAHEAEAEKLVRPLAGDVLAVELDAAVIGLVTPAMMLNSVVLPAPFGPISPGIEPRGTSNAQASTAVSPP